MAYLVATIRVQFIRFMHIFKKNLEGVLLFGLMLLQCFLCLESESLYCRDNWVLKLFIQILSWGLDEDSLARVVRMKKMFF